MGALESIKSAIVAIGGDMKTVTKNIGSLSSLNTTTKVSAVNAINEVNTAVKAAQSSVASKQDKLIFDAAPTSGSSNPVTSNGVASALSANSQLAQANEAFTVSGTASIALSMPSVFSSRLNPNGFASPAAIRVVNSTNKVGYASVSATHYYGPTAGIVRISMPANTDMTNFAQVVPIHAQEGLGIVWDKTVRVTRGGTAIGMLTWGNPDATGVVKTITDGTSGGTSSIAAGDVIVLNLTYRFVPYV